MGRFAECLVEDDGLLYQSRVRHGAVLPSIYHIAGLSKAVYYGAGMWHYG
jgi:hypothetical protein